MVSKYEAPKRVATYDSNVSAEDIILLGKRNSYGILSEDDDADTFQPPSLASSSNNASSHRRGGSSTTPVAAATTGTSGSTKSSLSQHPHRLVKSNSSVTSMTTPQERNAVDKELNDILSKYTSRDKMKLSQILGKYATSKNENDDEESQHLDNLVEEQKAKAATASVVDEERMDEMVSKYSGKAKRDPPSNSSKKAKSNTEPPAPQVGKSSNNSSGGGRPPLVTVVDYPSSGTVEVFGKLKTPKGKGMATTTTTPAEEIGHLSSNAVLSSMSKDDSLVTASAASSNGSRQQQQVQANASLSTKGEDEDGDDAAAKIAFHTTKTTVTNNVQSQDSFQSSPKSKSSSSTTSASRTSTSLHRKMKNHKSRIRSVKSKDSIQSASSKNSKSSLAKVPEHSLPVASGSDSGSIANNDRKPRSVDAPTQESVAAAVASASQDLSAANSKSASSSKKAAVVASQTDTSESSSKKGKLLVKTSSLVASQKVLISPVSPLVYGPPRVISRASVGDSTTGLSSAALPPAKAIVPADKVPPARTFVATTTTGLPQPVLTSATVEAESVSEPLVDSTKAKPEMATGLVDATLQPRSNSVVDEPVAIPGQTEEPQPLTRETPPLTDTVFNSSNTGLLQSITSADESAVSKTSRVSSLKDESLAALSDSTKAASLPMILPNSISLSKSGSGASGSVSSRRSRGSSRKGGGGLMKSSLSYSKSNEGGVTAYSHDGVETFGPPSTMKSCLSKSSSMDRSQSSHKSAVTFSEDDQHAPVPEQDSADVEVYVANETGPSADDADTLQRQTLSSAVSGSASGELSTPKTMSEDDARVGDPIIISRVSSTPVRVPSSTTAESSQNEDGPREANKRPTADQTSKATTGETPSTSGESSIIVLSSAEDEILIKVDSKNTASGYTAGVYSSEDDIIRIQEKEFGHFEEATVPLKSMAMAPDAIIDTEREASRLDDVGPTAATPPVQVYSPNDDKAPIVNKPESLKRSNGGFFARLQRPKAPDTEKPTKPAPLSLFTKAFARRHEPAKKAPEPTPPLILEETLVQRDSGEVSISAVIDENVVVERVSNDCEVVPDQVGAVEEADPSKKTAPITLVDHRSSRKVEMIGKILEQPMEPESDTAEASETAAVPSRKVGRKSLAQFIPLRFGRKAKPTQQTSGIQADSETVKPVDNTFDATPNTDVATESVVEEGIVKVEPELVDAHDDDAVVLNLDERSENAKGPLDSTNMTSEQSESKAVLDIATNDTIDTAGKAVGDQTMASMTDALMAWCSPKDDSVAGSAVAADGVVHEGKSQIFSPSNAMKSVQLTVMNWCSPRSGTGRGYTCIEDNTSDMDVVEEGTKVEEGCAVAPASFSNVFETARRSTQETIEEGCAAMPVSCSHAIDATRRSTQETLEEGLAAVPVSCSNAIDVTRRSTQETMTAVTTAAVGWCTPRAPNGDAQTNFVQKSAPSGGDNKTNDAPQNESEKKSISCSRAIDETMDSTQETVSSLTSAMAGWCTPRGPVQKEEEKSMKTDTLKGVSADDNNSTETANGPNCGQEVGDALTQIENLLPPSTNCATVPEQTDSHAQAPTDRSQVTFDPTENSLSIWTSNLTNWWAPKTPIAEGPDTLDKSLFANCVDSVAENVACVEGVDDMSLGEDDSNVEMPLDNNTISDEEPARGRNPPAAAEPTLPSPKEVAVAKLPVPVEEAPSKSLPKNAGRFKKAFRLPFGGLKRKPREAKKGEPAAVNAEESEPMVEVVKAEPAPLPKPSLTPVATVKVESETAPFTMTRELPSVSTTGDKSSVELNVSEVEHESQQETPYQFDHMNVQAISEEPEIDEAIEDSIDYLALVQEKREARSKRVASLVEDVELEAPIEEIETTPVLLQPPSVQPQKTAAPKGYRRVGFPRLSKQAKVTTNPAPIKSDNTPTQAKTGAVNPAISEDLSQNIRVCAVSDEEVEEMEMEASFSTSVGSHYPPSVGSHYPPSVQSDKIEIRQGSEKRPPGAARSSSLLSDGQTVKPAIEYPEKWKPRVKDEISMGPSSGAGTFDDDLSGVFAPAPTGTAGKWFW